MLKSAVTAKGSRPIGFDIAWLLLSLVLIQLVGTSTVSADAASEQAQPPLPVQTLVIGEQSLAVEIAATGQQRYMGLSFRTSMADNEGMLFVYPRERPLTFTMRNTLLPLSIAFIGADGVINEIIDMDVGPDQIFPSSQPAQFALEVNQGWFAKHGIKPGERVILR